MVSRQQVLHPPLKKKKKTEYQRSPRPLERQRSMVFRSGWIPDEHKSGFGGEIWVKYGNHMQSHHLIPCHVIPFHPPDDLKRLHACRSACSLLDEAPGAVGPHHALGHVATSMESAMPMARRASYLFPSFERFG